MNKKQPKNIEQKPLEGVRAINPLLERARLPGETHRIPSRGMFYTNGELDQTVRDGEIHVYPMTTIDEILLKSPDKLFSGDAIVEVFKKCAPQVVDPLNLFAKDVDFLLVALRKISYGDQTEIKYTHTCKKAKEQTYLVSISSFLKKTRYLDPLKISEEYKVTLDNGQVVEMHPIKFKDVLQLIQTMTTEIDDDTEKSPEDIQNKLVSSTASIIRRVDEVEDKDFIEEWLRSIPPLWSKKLSAVIEKTGQWGPDLSETLTCKDCEGEVKINPVFNPLIFFSA